MVTTLPESEGDPSHGKKDFVQKNDASSVVISILSCDEKESCYYSKEMVEDEVINTKSCVNHSLSFCLGETVLVVAGHELSMGSCTFFRFALKWIGSKMQSCAF